MWNNNRKANCILKKEIVINTSSSETRVAILEEGQLVELYVERSEHERMVGDIFLGKVENVVQAIQAAFVNIGLEQNGFLSFEDVGREYIALAERVGGGQKRKRTGREGRTRVQLKPGQNILVQVTKEPIGSKGTRLTSSISLPGRFLVLVPNDNAIGVSRKINDPRERRRLRRLARSIQPKGFGLIIRTVAVGKDVQTMSSDLDALLKKWKRIEEKSNTAKPPCLIHKDVGITSSVIRDLVSPDIDRIVVDSRKLYGTIKKYLREVADGLLDKLELYRKKTPVFDEFHVEEEIEKSFSRKIWMKSGGYIVFDQTEAMVVVDVNSGRSVGEKDHEKNALKTDLEAARLIARQLRLRDIGGIIVIDFIDLATEANRKKVGALLKKELRKDRVAFDIRPMNDFGLVSLTRGRVRPSLLYRYSEPCPRCEGLGRVPAKSAIITKIERQIQHLKITTRKRRFLLRVHPDLEQYLSEGVRSRIRFLMMKFFVTIQLEADPELTGDTFHLKPLKDSKTGRGKK
jgi:ribonuclease G